MLKLEKHLVTSIIFSHFCVICTEISILHFFFNLFLEFLGWYLL